MDSGSQSLNDGVQRSDDSKSTMVSKYNKSTVEETFRDANSYFIPSFSTSRSGSVVGNSKIDAFVVTRLVAIILPCLAK